MTGFNEMSTKPETDWQTDAEKRWGNLRYPGKTVYLLGAGFSAPMGIPTLKDFIPIGLAELCKDAGFSGAAGEVQASQRIVEAMNKLLPTFQGAVSCLGCALGNLEDLFCLVDLAAQTGPVVKIDNKEPRQVLTEFIHQVITLCAKSHEAAIKKPSEPPRKWKVPTLEARQFSAGYQSATSPKEKTRLGLPTSLPTATGDVCAYEAFVSRLLSKNAPLSYAEEDVVVTLNYDLVVEDAVRRIESKASGKVNYLTQYLPPLKGEDKALAGKVKTGNKPNLTIYKLHGSTDWKFENASHRKVLRIADCPPSTKKDTHYALVPPTWSKSAGPNSQWQKIYEGAMWHLKRADKIVIIGYSFPDTDAYFRYLLATAMNTPQLPSISVVGLQAKKSAMKNYKPFLKPVARGEIRYFEDGFPNYLLKEGANE